VVWHARESSILPSLQMKYTSRCAPGECANRRRSVLTVSRYVSHCGLLFTTCVLELMRFARDGQRAIHNFIDAEKQPVSWRLASPSWPPG